MANNMFCTNCLYGGVKLEECYTHYPGKDCPTPTIYIDDIICIKCNQKGHLPYNCNAKKCNYCKEFGHLVKNCEKLAHKLEREQNKWCSFCEEYGHNLQGCTNEFNYMNVNNYCNKCKMTGHNWNNCLNRYK